MPKTRQVTSPDGTYVNIRASIPVHYLKIYKDGLRDTQLQYKRPEDNFTADYTTALSDAIEIIGHGRKGIIGRPPNYNVKEPVTTASGAHDSGGGDIIAKVKAADGSAITLVVYESESEL